MFEPNLSYVWEMWDSYFEGKPGNPFDHKQRFSRTDMESSSLCSLLETISYLQGIHHALGWSLENPRGPREWQPGRG